MPPGPSSKGIAGVAGQSFTSYLHYSVQIFIPPTHHHIILEVPLFDSSLLISLSVIPTGSLSRSLSLSLSLSLSSLSLSLSLPLPPSRSISLSLPPLPLPLIKGVCLLFLFHSVLLRLQILSFPFLSLQLLSAQTHVPWLSTTKDYTRSHIDLCVNSANLVQIN